jgi:hypothetical protein
LEKEQVELAERVELVEKEQEEGKVGLQRNGQRRNGHMLCTRCQGSRGKDRCNQTDCRQGRHRQ